MITATAGYPTTIYYHVSIGAPAQGQVVAPDAVKLRTPFCASPNSYASVCPEGGCPQIGRVRPGLDGEMVLFGASLPVGNDATLQQVADLEGFWLSLHLQPSPPASLGAACATAQGVVISSLVAPDFAGHELMIGAKSVGKIIGIVHDSQGNSVLSATALPASGSLQGVAVASPPAISANFQGAPGIGAMLELDFTPTAPFVGNYELRLNRGYQAPPKSPNPSLVDFSAVVERGCACIR